MATASTAIPGRTRITSIDVMRGLVMVVMLLDHVRDMVHLDSHAFSPTDLDHTTPILFFTRWVTHFCAPVFVLLAGVGAQRQADTGMSRGTLARFLVSRGLWLIFLELTAVRLGAFFDFDLHTIGLFQVIWAIGASMILLAPLVYLPLPALATFGLGMIALHNLLDGVGPATPTYGSPTPIGVVVWMFLHRAGPIFFPGGQFAYVMYPLIPWVGVMAAGFALGAVYRWEVARRRRFLILLGAGASAAFIVLRTVGVYGDPSPFTAQPTAMRALMSFLNTTKYPPSLEYLLMTLGPAMMGLALLERTAALGRVSGALETLGRVPLFYYLLQWPFAHLCGLVLGLLAGQPVTHLFRSPPDAFRLAYGRGFSLATVYACWVLGILVLYPLCRAYGRKKREQKKWWMSYL